MYIKLFFIVFGVFLNIISSYKLTSERYHGPNPKVATPVVYSVEETHDLWRPQPFKKVDYDGVTSETVQIPSSKKSSFSNDKILQPPLAFSYSDNTNRNINTGLKYPESKINEDIHYKKEIRNHDGKESEIILKNKQTKDDSDEHSTEQDRYRDKNDDNNYFDTEESLNDHDENYEESEKYSRINFKKEDEENNKNLKDDFKPQNTDNEYNKDYNLKEIDIKENAEKYYPLQKNKHLYLYDNTPKPLKINEYNHKISGDHGAEDYNKQTNNRYRPNYTKRKEPIETYIEFTTSSTVQEPEYSSPYLTEYNYKINNRDNEKQIKYKNLTELNSDLNKPTDNDRYYIIHKYRNPANIKNDDLEERQKQKGDERFYNNEFRHGYKSKALSSSDHYNPSENHERQIIDNNYENKNINQAYPENFESHDNRAQGTTYEVHETSSGGGGGGGKSGSGGGGKVGGGGGGGKSGSGGGGGKSEGGRGGGKSGGGGGGGGKSGGGGGGGGGGKSGGGGGGGGKSGGGGGGGGKSGGGGGGGGKFEKGGGKNHDAKHYASKSEKGDKGYKGHHEYEKGEKGHHDKEGHKGEYSDHGGQEKKHHAEDGHFGKHYKEEKGEKGAKYAEGGKHEKGHSTKGEHNIHKKDEYEKKHEFFDEYHEESGNEKHGGYHAEHEGHKGGSKKGGHHKSAYEHDDHGKKGYTEKGHHYDEGSGHKKAAGKDDHHKHYDKYDKKDGKDVGKKWAYKNGNGGGKHK